MIKRILLTQIAVLTLLAPLSAQTTKRNVFQRHPTASGVGAAMVTHHALKQSAARKKANGQKLNFAERHPTLTSIGVGATTRHALKHSH